MCSMFNTWLLTCTTDGGLCFRPKPLSTGCIWPSSIGSDRSARMWTDSGCLLSETSMLTGRGPLGDTCARAIFEPGVTFLPQKLHWLLSSPCWLDITDGWTLLYELGETLYWPSESSDGLWLAEVAERGGFRNLAHSWPIVISSSRLNDPRPNSKSL